MRIITLLTDAFGGIGGIAQFNRNMLQAFSRMEIVEEVTAIPRIIHHNDYYLPKKISYETGATGGKLNFILTVIGYMLRSSKYDLLILGHINLLPMAVLGRLFGLRCRTVLILHGIEAWKVKESILTKISLKLITEIISVSEVTKNRFCEWSGFPSERCSILPNCVDMEKYTPGKKNEEILSKYRLEGKKVLLTVGRLDSEERYKGFDVVIDALPELIKKCPEITYVIAGDGKDRSRLKAKVKSLQMDGYVIFAGYVNESEKIGWYRTADVFVMPSKGEGFGIVLLEAMACGLPVIGSKKDGTREALQGGKLGPLVDPDKVAEVVDAVLVSLKESHRSFSNGLSDFSQDNFNNKVEKLFQSP